MVRLIALTVFYILLNGLVSIVYINSGAKARFNESKAINATSEIVLATATNSIFSIIKPTVQTKPVSKNLTKEL